MKDLLRFEGKRVVVVGAATGMGEATARTLVEPGAEVVALDGNPVTAPIGRDATPEEMAEPLIFLGSNAARFISGHNLFVDYGYVGSVQIGDRAALL